MYNRYIRNDAGIYERVSVADHPEQPHSKENSSHTVHAPTQTPNTPPNSAHSSPLAGLLGKEGLLSGILDKLKLSDIDTGDLLLLVILFLLFRDGGDDELLIALGLLLIL